ncbi:MAG TPA: hypothetical protein VHP81_08580 [Lachnospiraceae bacterium]|nr:hypothetical protein [Lachnospiraceae bacterium]
MVGYVKALWIQPERKLPFQRVHAAKLIVQNGMEGDCHATQTDRQITLLSSEVEQWMTLEYVKGLCFPKFSSNILMEGIDIFRLKEGDILKVEDAILKIRRYPKRCFGECTRVQEELPCMLKEGILYATVIQTGYIHDGDTIYCFGSSC